MLKARSLVCLSLVLALVGVSAQAATKTKKGAVASRSELRTTSGFDLENKLVIEPSFGFSFISPGDANSVIRDDTDALQKKGYKSYNPSDIGSAISYGIATTYRVTPDVGLGVGFSRLSAGADGSSKVNDQTINGNYSVAATMLTAETRFTFLRSADRKFEAVLSPFVGIGFYNGSTQFSGTGMANGLSTEENTSAKGIVFGSTVGGRYWFSPNIAWSINAGYRSAKSGDLKIDSQRNTGDDVGSYAENNGKKSTIDASSVVIGTGITLSI